jgi:intracellular sulfur oxidation DsrE/DsrF family protein
MTSPRQHSANSVLIQVINDGMGAADTNLQHTLLRKYLLLLQENNTLPAAICFYTSGVKMVVEGSPVLDVLQSLEARGVRLIVCKTCLDYYGLTCQVGCHLANANPARALDRSHRRRRGMIFRLVLRGDRGSLLRVVDEIREKLEAQFRRRRRHRVPIGKRQRRAAVV